MTYLDFNHREIKFRAFHKPTNKMFNVYSFGGDAIFEDCEDGIGIKG